MTRREEIEKEIKTIKPRKFALNLSDADIEKLYSFAYSNGTTPTEIIEGFVMDLINGTYTHGSDERDLAQRYFERCCYNLGADNTFLSWALNGWLLEEITENLETLQSASEDLKYYEDNPEEADAGEIEAIKQAQKDAGQAIEEIYKDYAEEQEAKKEKAQELQEGIASITGYLAEIADLKG